MIALPFRIINEVAEVIGSIYSLVFPTEPEEEEVIEQPEYPDPVEVKGFHAHSQEAANNKTEEKEFDHDIC